MIVDARALREDWLPQELLHREGSIEHLSSTLRPITHGLNGEHAVIDGPSGVGKTTTAKYVLRQLDGQTLNATWGYVDCLSNSTTSAVLHELVRAAGYGTYRREGTSENTYLDELRAHDTPFVAVLDEADVIEDLDVLKMLYDLSNVTLVLICVDEKDLFTRLSDSRLHSRLKGLERIRLDPYSTAELRDILDGRVEAGLDPTTVTDDALDAIADHAAGDARYAITILRKAVEQVLDGNADQVTVDVVADQVSPAETALHKTRVESLDTDHRLLYDIIKEHGEITGSELREKYRDRRANPVASSTRRSYLRALERYEMIEARGNGPARTYAPRP